MEQRGPDQRPPRSARPGQQQQQQQQQHTSQQPRSPAPPYHDQSIPTRPQPRPQDRTGVSFQNIEQGDRRATLDANRQRTLPSAYQPNIDPEHEQDSRVYRKKSLVRPDREKIDPGHRQWHYRSHVAQLEEEGSGRVGVMPSSASFS